MMRPIHCSINSAARAWYTMLVALQTGKAHGPFALMSRSSNALASAAMSVSMRQGAAII